MNDRQVPQLLQGLWKRIFVLIPAVLIGVVLIISSIVSSAPGVEWMGISSLLFDLPWGEVPEKLAYTIILTGGAMVISLTCALLLGSGLADRETDILEYAHSPRSRFTKVGLRILGGIKAIATPCTNLLDTFSYIPLFLTGYLAYILSYLAGFSPRAIGESVPVSKLLLPILLLGFGNGRLAEMIQTIQSEIATILREPYIKAAMARGVSVLEGSLRSVIPSLLGLLVSHLILLLGGAIVIEVIFTIPGMGLWALDAVRERNVPEMIVITLTMVGIVTVVDLLVELLRAWSDPR